MPVANDVPITGSSIRSSKMSLPNATMSTEQPPFEKSQISFSISLVCAPTWMQLGHGTVGLFGLFPSWMSSHALKNDENGLDINCSISGTLQGSEISLQYGHAMSVIGLADPSLPAHVTSNTDGSWWIRSCSARKDGGIFLNDLEIRKKKQKSFRFLRIFNWQLALVTSSFLIFLLSLDENPLDRLIKDKVDKVLERHCAQTQRNNYLNGKSVTLEYQPSMVNLRYIKPMVTMITIRWDQWTLQLKTSPKKFAICWINWTIMNENVFIFRNVYYKQTEGTGIGCSVSSFVAQFFMCKSKTINCFQDFTW